MKVRSIRGFNDILPDAIKRWHYLEDSARSIFELYGFSEIRTPVLELTDLFARSIGATTDIVEKEMYTFTDRDGSSLTLRPEGTAGVVRAFIEHSLHLKSPIWKLYYIGTMFRHERPQKGRYRAFNQIGVEYMGSSEPYVDAEVITMLWRFLDRVGVSGVLRLEVSSLGDKEARGRFRELLTQYFGNYAGTLCEDCRRRLMINPLRILDCKKEQCAKVAEYAPSILDHLNHDSLIHFESVKEGLSLSGVPYVVNPRIVRGLDYYTKTVFEVTTPELGAQNAVAAGGRYDGLVEELGGVPTPAVGFAVGMERLVLLLEKLYPEGFVHRSKVFVAHTGLKERERAYVLANDLRKQGIPTEIDYELKSLKSQLKRADKLLVRFTVIVGEEELKRGKVRLRDMAQGAESEVDIDKIGGLIVELCR